MQQSGDLSKQIGYVRVLDFNDCLTLWQRLGALAEATLGSCVSDIDSEREHGVKFRGVSMERRRSVRQLSPAQQKGSRGNASLSDDAWCNLPQAVSKEVVDLEEAESHVSNFFPKCVLQQQDVVGLYQNPLGRIPDRFI